MEIFDQQPLFIDGKWEAATGEAAAPTAEKVTLEMGDKSPSLVLASANFDAAVTRIAQTCFSNISQSCDVPTRPLAERTINDRVKEVAKKAAKDQVVNDPLKPGDHTGPLVSELQNNKVRSLFQRGIEEEAIRIANDAPYGLAGYIDTDDDAQASRVSSQLRVGVAHNNGADIGWVSSFGGQKMSGIRREGGHLGIHEFPEIEVISR